MNYFLITYIAYIILTLILTSWVGKTLFVNGKIFLMDIFKNDELLVNSINKLLLIGFYLVNFGYALRNLIERSQVNSAVQSVEMLSRKVGLIIITLGIMHFLNLFVLFAMRSKSKRSSSTTIDNSNGAPSPRPITTTE